MPALTLPLTFTNSFWSQDYRRGLETLFSKLEQGVAENDEIVNFIRARVIAENNIAATLSNPPATGPASIGFGADDGASLLNTFRGLQRESITQGEAHKALATDLEELVVEPFKDWADKHAGRVEDVKRGIFDGRLRAYELTWDDIAKLQNQYHMKTRKADEAEDDAKFAPNNSYGDNYTPSPRQTARDIVVNRTPSVSERITERLRALRPVQSSARQPPPEIVFTDDDKNEEDGDKTPQMDKGKGKALGSPVQMSPPPLSPPLPARKDSIGPLPPRPPTPILLAGIAFSPAALSALLKRALQELPLRSVRLPIIGEYKDCFSGEEFVNWLQKGVEAFGDSFELAEEAAKDLTEDEGLLRRIGGIGNAFDPTEDAFYQIRPKAFTLEEDRVNAGANGPALAAQAKPVADNIVKQSNAFANFVIKQIKASNDSQPPHVRARIEAEEADEAYRQGIRRLDRLRLALEDHIEESLKLLQRWETDRLRAVKTVLLQYQGTLSTLSKKIQPSIEHSSTLIAAFQPESDLVALMERYRTGPFRPRAHVYESVAHDTTDVFFGLDLRKWAGESSWPTLRSAPDDKKDAIPPVLAGLLSTLKSAYPKMQSDEERRKTWVYEVPLTIVHHLREAINALPLDQPIPEEFFEKCDGPLLASTVRLWLLEVNPPVALWEGWDDIKKIYPSFGSKTDLTEQQLIEQLQSALIKWPKAHLYVFDALVKHLKELIAGTKSDEDPEIYVTKLALALGRAIIRPRHETEMSIQDRHPTLFFVDLLKHYDAVLPPTIVRKKRESQKQIPMRKRTALVDQRINRRSNDSKTLLEVREQQITNRPRNYSATGVPPAPPPVPTPAAPPSTRSAPPAEDDGVPPRPKFASPPPEDDDVPPRPKFTTPPLENDEIPAPSSMSANAPVVVSPATPKRVQSPATPVRSGTPDTPSVVDDDKPVSSAGSAALHRSGSAETTRVRGPRVGGARGPRGPAGAGFASASSTSSPSHNRTGSIGRTSISNIEGLKRNSGKVSPVPTGRDSPKRRGGKPPSGTFSRRTMASGSEDEVVDK